MIGISRVRDAGPNDPVLRAKLEARGIKEIPLFRKDSPKRGKADWSAPMRRWTQLADERDGPVNAAAPMRDPAAFTQALRAKAIELGAGDFGCAALAPIMIDEGVEFDLPNIIAIIVEESYGAVLNGALAVETQAIDVYVRCAEIATALAAHIREQGYAAIADHNGTGDIQAIPALYACGLGELGKHGSLIHPKFGAGFRPGFVITNAPVTRNAPTIFGVQDTCLHCNLCTNNCPPAAIPPTESYVVTEGVRRWLTDVDRCYEASRMRDEYCHICVDVCPFVHKANGDEQRKSQYKTYLAKRRTAGYRTPSWFIEDEDRVLGKK